MKKKHIRLIGLLLGVITLTACSGGLEDPPTPVNPVVIPSEFTNISISESATQSMVTFTAATDWTIGLTTKATPDWMTVSPMEGKAGRAEIQIKTVANTDSIDRSATISINADGKSYPITVTQKGTTIKAALAIDKELYQVGDKAESFAVKVSSNAGWTIQKKATWLSFSTLEGHGDATIDVECLANPETTERRDTVRFVADKLVCNLVVIQKGKSAEGLAKLSEVILSDITVRNARAVASIISKGKGEIIEKGICWSTSKNPGKEDGSTDVGSKGDEISVYLTNLQPNTLYYVRAYAINSEGIAYGPEKSFTTVAAVSKPIVKTGEITDIKSNSAIGGAELLDNGGENPLTFGICWATTQNPTIDNYTYNIGSSANSFSDGAMLNLQPLTKYYVRAYASNSQGISYGEEKNFTTPIDIVLETTIYTCLVSSISVAVNLSAADVSKIKEIGICYSIKAGATIQDSRKPATDIYGGYLDTILDLALSTRYYFNSYAILTDGSVVYGNEVSAKTLGQKATVETTTSTNVTKNSITIGGNITNDGGDEITSRGVCWSMRPDPTVTLTTKSENGTGVGKFSHNITGLKPVTIYYIRAYAVNASGVAYGEQVTISTKGGGEISDFEQGNIKF